jgi:hypothetical protein
VRAANDDTEGGADERPGWLTENLVEQTLRAFHPNALTPITKADAVRVILSMSQLLEAIGLLNMESTREGNEEKIYGLGQGEWSGTGA